MLVLPGSACAHNDKSTCSCTIWKIVAPCKHLAIVQAALPEPEATADLVCQDVLLDFSTVCPPYIGHSYYAVPICSGDSQPGCATPYKSGRADQGEPIVVLDSSGREVTELRFTLPTQLVESFTVQSGNQSCPGTSTIEIDFPESEVEGKAQCEVCSCCFCTARMLQRTCRMHASGL
jgi:hypothetical protein